MRLSMLKSLPPLPRDRVFESVRRAVAASRTKIVVLDDDPTGTQTVHGIDILADWSVASLAAALSDPRSCFYILSNTRSLPETDAVAVVREIASNLSAAAACAGAEIVLISRSDSTLRGHFAAELGALEEGMGRPVDGKIVVPAFFEGGRYTVGNIHYVAEGEDLVPAAQTEFARDRTFGYSNSDLTRWIEEKTGGGAKADKVASVGIETLRGPGGPESVRRSLLELPKGAFMVVNAADYCDLEVFVSGLLLAEARGRRFLLRTAASFVRVRAGIEPQPLLAPSAISDPGIAGGLVVVGSYTAKTTAQLDSLLALPGAVGIELDVDALAARASGLAEISRVSDDALGALRSGRHAVVFTSRGRESAAGRAGDLATGRIVSDALEQVVRSIPFRPRFLIAKGGITSCDVAIRGLGMRKALVLGQASLGVPVWEMGPETRYPGMKLVVWPGNVGSVDALRELVRHS